MNADEGCLVQAAKSGDDRAFATLVDRNQRSVRGFICRFTGYWSGADDITQDAFVVAWRRLHRFDGRSSFRAWVCGIAYRLARDAHRRHQRAMLRDSDWATQTPTTSETSFEEDRLALRRALANLPDQHCAAVVLCIAEGFSHTEAAAILGLPLGTVKSHVLRGRERLVAALSAQPEVVDDE